MNSFHKARTGAPQGDGVRLSLILSWVLLSALTAQAGELKVDINRDSKNSAAETEVGYVKWSQDSTGGASSGTNPVTKTFTSATGETITVSFAQTALSVSRGGTGLLSNWYQTGAQGTAKLVSDGLTVAPANLATGGQMQMTITGLSAGRHTLLTYHNAWDALAAGSLGPMDIYVNGVESVDNLQPTIRAATNAAAPIAYLEFDVAGPGAVTTILFAAETSGTAAIKNVMVNAFEIDTPNSTRIAQAPSPADGDEHANADTGALTLAWSPPSAGGAASYDIYFGTDRDAVRNASRSSPEFIGNLGGLSKAVSGIQSQLTYYWRVDAVDSLGNVTRGTIWYFRPRHLAFPGAEGYGRFARGGRGGRVVEVTSLADYIVGETPIPGTLRYAIEQETGPRTIVFNTSGMITLRSRLTLSSPYVTIAGQTAPGKGICLRQYPLGLSGAKDAIVRFIRNRPGNISGTTMDGGGLAGCDHSIMDHCSISWSIDEAFSSRSGKNITLQRTLISEALNIAGHQNYPAGTKHGYAASVGGDIASLHHNLLAHCEGRNWSMAGGLDSAGYFAGRLDIFNNVVYNWGTRTTDGGAHEVNFVNNYYKPGAASTIFTALNPTYDNFPGSQQYYMAGNVMPGRFDESNQAAGRTVAGSNGGSVPTSYSPWVNTPFFPSYATIDTARAAYERVLSDVGCNQPLLDDHDVRVIRETRDGTFTYTGTGPYGGSPGLPNSQDDVGGWEDYGNEVQPANWDTDHDGMPNYWELAMGSDSNLPDQDADLNGDTALEVYLNWLAAPHAINALNTVTTFDLAPYAAGFTSPVFQVTNPAHGSVMLLPDGHTARFTPMAGFQGVGTFDFTVTAGGTTMSQTVGICFTPAIAPVLSVEKPGGADVPNGGSVGFGSVGVGMNSSLTFTLKNSGTAELQGLGMTIDGTNADSFSVSANPIAPVSAPSGSTTFTVRFQPTAIGPHSAALHIASNDPQRNPFDILLGGSATETTAPALTSVAIGSSGSNSAFAKSGQTVSLTITANENIEQPVVNIASQAAVVTGSGQTWTATITVAPSTTEGAAAFSIAFQDIAGNAGSTATATTQGSHVTIDTTAPTLTPPANVTLPATIHGGAPVSHAAATAGDSGSGLVSLTYSPPNGALFPVGTTTVTVIALDNAGNSTQGTFTVTVSPPPAVSQWAATSEPVSGAGESGSGVPAGATWRTFGIPGIDNGPPSATVGSLVFLGSFSSPTGGVQSGIFGFGGSAPLIAKSGDDAPDAAGTKFLTFREPVGNGGTAFVGTLQTIPGLVTKKSDQGLWTNSLADASGALRLVAWEGSGVSVLPGFTYKEITDIALNGGGSLFWTATLAGNGVTAAKDGALFAQASLAGGVRLLLREGQPISIGNTTPLLKSFIALRDGGKSYGDGLSGGGTGYGSGRADGGALTPVLLTLDDKRVAIATVGLGQTLKIKAVTDGPVPGIAGATWKTLGVPAAASSGIVAFRGALAVSPPGGPVTKDNAAVLFAEAPGNSLKLLAQQGDNAPDLVGLKYLAFSDPYLNAAGDVIFFARFSGSGVAVKSEALYWQPLGDTTASLVARTGGDAPEINGGIIAKFTGASLPQITGANDPRGPVFTATLKAGPGGVKATDSAGLWAVDSTGAIRLLARTGSLVKGKTLKTIGAFLYVTGSPMQSRTAVSTPSVIYRATFTDHSMAIIEVAVP